MPPSLNINLGRRSGANIVGLDIQPGLVAAVQAHVNGSIVAERAAILPLPSDTVREGEVIDEGALADTLRELFADNRLSKRVRLGVANQRTVLRTLDLPPVTDRKELDAVVRFQAQDQVPMPLNNAVLDFHPLGVVDTPAGPRQRVVLVAAQRDMVERLLSAARRAGLRPEGIDLSAFALIRSLYRSDDEHAGRVLYLNVDGLTNLAIAEGTVCRFTRVVGSGLEGMAVELAERRGIALIEARALLFAADLDVSADGGPGAVVAPEGASGPDRPAASEDDGEGHDAAATVEESNDSPAVPADELAMSYAEELSSMEQPPAEQPSAEQTSATPTDSDVRVVLDNGIREIAGEVRNSLDFHRSQDGGGEVTRIVLSGAALDLPGFAAALQGQLGIEVHSESVATADTSLADGLTTHRLAVAAGLATTEAPR
jgi:type IV pilus assembly protein PilM